MLLELAVGAVAGSIVTVVSPKVYVFVKSKLTKAEASVTSKVDVAVSDVKKVA